MEIVGNDQKRFRKLLTLFEKSPEIFGKFGKKSLYGVYIIKKRNKQKRKKIQKIKERKIGRRKGRKEERRKKGGRKKKERNCRKERNRQKKLQKE